MCHPAASQPPNKAMPRQAPWHRPAKRAPALREAVKIQRRARNYRQRAGTESTGLDGTEMRYSAAEWRPEIQQPQRKQEMTAGRRVLTRVSVYSHTGHGS